MLSPQSEKNQSSKSNVFDESKLLYGQRVQESAKIERIDVDMEENKVSGLR